MLFAAVLDLFEIVDQFDSRCGFTRKLANHKSPYF
jgi:hypothetical protein